MRRPAYLPALALVLALAGPGHAAAPNELCNVLVLMGAVLTLPSETATDRFQGETLRDSVKMEQCLIRRAHQALDKASGQRALPAATIAQYREILSDRAKGHRTDSARSEGLARVKRQVQQNWRQVCKPAEDRSFASEEPDVDAIGPRRPSGTTPEHLARGISEQSRPPEDWVSSRLSGVTAAHQWRMLAAVIAAAGVFGLAGKGYVEMQGRRKRRARRFVCDVGGSLLTDNGMAPVRVRDISRLGCLLRINLGPAAKTRCRVWIHDRWLEGRVAWSNKCYVGLEFKQLQSREFIIEIARGGRKGAPANPSAPPQMPQQGA